MQTGVKSFGCEKSTAHESPIQSWKLMRPSVVSASKSGAVSPICNAILVLSLRLKRARAERRAVRLPRRSAYDSEPARTSITSRSKAELPSGLTAAAPARRTRSATASPLRRTPTRRASRSSPGPPPVARLGLHPVLEALGDLVLAELDVELVALDVDDDMSPSRSAASGPPRDASGRDVADHEPVRRSGESPVGDERDRVARALRRRSPPVTWSISRMPGPPCGPS